MKLFPRCPGFFAAVLLANLACTLHAQPPVPADSPRRTATVQIIERCMPSVISIQTFRQHETPGVFYIGSGSGSVVHEDGYILTNDHVVWGAVRGEVLLDDKRVVPYHIVAKFRHEDIALLKIDIDEPLKALTLGRSHDLMLGEPAMAIGSPGGLVRSVSTGIISGLNRATATEHTFLPWMIQTSAAVSGGNSGGPLINALGEQIGIVTSKNGELENVNFAITIDRVRDVLPRMIAAEQRVGIWLGVEVDTLGPTATVTKVAADSPAEKAGILAGDVIRKFGEKQIRSGIDFHFALLRQKPGDSVKVQFNREQKELDTQVTLADFPVADPVDDIDMKKGLRYAAYSGAWSALPDFSKLEPVATGEAERPDLSAHKPSDENFALRYTGFIKCPADGLYTFYTTSDDGSRLYIGDGMVVDNDGLHASRESAGLVRLKTGLHPITITMFENSGDEVLQIAVEGPQLERQELTGDFFFIRKE